MDPDLSDVTASGSGKSGLNTQSIFFFFQKLNCHNRDYFDRNQEIDAQGML